MKIKNLTSEKKFLGMESDQSFTNFLKLFEISENMCILSQHVNKTQGYLRSLHISVLIK